MLKKETLLSSTNIGLIPDEEGVRGIFAERLVTKFIEDHDLSDMNVEEFSKLYKASSTLKDNYTLLELLTTESDELMQIVIEKAIFENLDMKLPKGKVFIGADGSYSTDDYFSFCELVTWITDGISNGKYELFLFLSDDILPVLSYFGFTEKQEDEDENPRSYRIDFSIGYHRDYSVVKLYNRVMGRLNYRWSELSECHVSVCDNGEGNDFTGFAEITVYGQQFEEVYEHILFRLGSTSGKPWKQFKVIKVKRI